MNLCSTYRWIVLLALWALLGAGNVAAQTIIVEPEGPVPTLEQALILARNGDRIEIRAGIYREPTVEVDKSVVIIGTPGAILDGEGQRQIMTITADSVTVRGLLFRNVGVSFMEDRAAIKVEGARNCVIENNRIENAFFGIYLAKAAYCRVTGNTLESNGTRETDSGNGIHLWYSRYITIENNHISGHRDGIYFEFVEDSVIRGNISDHNMRYGLHFMFSDRCRYQSNEFRDNSAGVAVMYTNDMEMTDNRFLHNWGSASYGLLLKEIRDSHITGNTFDGNSVGLYVEGVSRVTVANNSFSENGWAIKIMSDSDDNLFMHNNFAGNSFDVATNSRRNYSHFESNFWDHYEGFDLDRDGFGDVPFRPVRLFSFMVEKNEPSLVLMRSLFIDLLDAAERVLPVLTPETLVDKQPLMRAFEASETTARESSQIK